jgi:tellurite resistance protein TerC
MQPFGFPTETILLFVGLVAIFVWIDLFTHRNAEHITLRNALAWSLVWVATAIGFYFYLRIHHTPDYADLFLAGYVLEKSLSIDNLMVFMAIFASFGVKGGLQHRILYYGIIGAVVFRMLFIVFGTTLFGLTPWIQFGFALVVFWTGLQMLRGSEDKEIEDYTHHWAVRWTQAVMPVFPRLNGKYFFVSRARAEQMRTADSSINVASAAWYVTPAFLCLMVIEASDILFSFDSVPAVIAVTREPLLVYSAVIFAILGLRSLYFVLEVAAKYLCHLGTAVAILLFFVAFKLALTASNEVFNWPLIHISPVQSLMIILGVLTLGVLASLVFPEGEDKTT